VRTDGQTDVTKLTVGFRSFVKAPKNCPSPRLYVHDVDTTAATRFATSGKSLPVQHNTAQHTQRTQNSGNPEDTDLIYTKQNAISRFTPLKKKKKKKKKTGFDETHTEYTDAKDPGSSVTRLVDAAFCMIIYGYRLMRFLAWCFNLVLHLFCLFLHICYERRIPK
jgi:hypothetical protein